jgi:hypothetical protein
VSVFALDAVTGERLELIATAVAGDDGWVNLSEALVVRAGGFVAVAGSPRSGVKPSPAARCRSRRGHALCPENGCDPHRLRRRGEPWR